jgi:hypothetical protein
MATLDQERQDFEDILEAYLQQFIGTGGGTGGTGTILPTRLTIINAVKAKIDELIPEGEGIQFSLETTPNVSNPYDIFINVIMDECAKELLLIVPIHVIVPVSMSGNGIQMTSDEYGRTGYFVLPENFLRLQSFQMEEWDRPVLLPITPLDPLYSLQKNKFVRGGLSKPVAVFNWKNTNKVLEYYSVESSHLINHLRYIPETLPENVQGNLFDALTWLIAHKVLQIVGTVELSKLAYERTIMCFKDMH